MLAQRTFDLDDQRHFARVTGDWNPIHVDEVAARRTMAGSPIVHGIHTLLWLLESIGSQMPDLPEIARFRVNFGKMLYLGELAQATVLKQDGKQLRAKVSVGSVDIMQLIVGFGAARPRSADVGGGAAAGEVLNPSAPLETTLEAMATQRGRLAFASDADEIARMFPMAARMIGPRRVAGLGCSTRLVGMVVPGLHSIFGGLEVGFTTDEDSRSAIDYQVSTVQPELRYVRVEISGGGMLGHVEAFNRPEPIAQPSVALIRSKVAAAEFEGSIALVVGGSRGLGELVGKIVAAGGGKVVLTYVAGKADAERVAQDIVEGGGDCHVVPYDVSGDPESQLKSLPAAPSHIYYFATPSIFRRKTAAYSPAVFQQFNVFYVAGFYALIEQMMRDREPKDQLSVFYPSSSALDQRPDNMTEYAMSKAAGEILCQDLDRRMKNLRILTARLPRILTDQTASISDVESADALETLIPLVRDVQRGWKAR
ncbi:SDR family NAD(P)-dependent oxidoreductase [Bradyrhizobium commune]|uniref:MaoC-like domain-containing protein n=1 Tax=Bradyrhizobium commune TaxID=83627 RepID=A0A7S9D309_9BRAD|nr:MaoC/PaaZ C-terminal domain-containing protein [Bradyrhizobium commune]QPF90272.1 hypothetical protein IC761_27795 [Bradyrhizobium commune]